MGNNDLVIQIAGQFVSIVVAVIGSAGFWSYITNRKSKKSGVKEQINTIVVDIEHIKKAQEESEKYRKEREEREATKAKKDQEREEMEKVALLNLMQDALLKNAKECMTLGYYDMERRRVYKAMYETYTNDYFQGDGVIHDLQPIMEKLPMEPPVKKQSK